MGIASPSFFFWIGKLHALNGSWTQNLGPQPIIMRGGGGTN